MKTAGYYPKSRQPLSGQMQHFLTPSALTPSSKKTKTPTFLSTKANVHHRLLHFSTKGLPSKAEREYFGLRGPAPDLTHSFNRSSLLQPAPPIITEHFKTEEPQELTHFEGKHDLKDMFTVLQTHDFDPRLPETLQTEVRYKEPRLLSHFKPLHHDSSSPVLSPQIHSRGLKGKKLSEQHQNPSPTQLGRRSSLPEIPVAFEQQQTAEQKFASLNGRFQSAKYSVPKRGKKFSLRSSKVNSPSCSAGTEEEAPMTIRKVCVEIKSSKILRDYLGVTKKTKFRKQTSDVAAVKIFNPYIKSVKPKLYFGRKGVEDAGKTARTGSQEGNQERMKRKKEKRKKRAERPLSALSGCSKWTVGSGSKDKKATKYSRNPVLKENDSNGLSENSMTKYVRERVHQVASPARGQIFRRVHSPVAAPYFSQDGRSGVERLSSPAGGVRISLEDILLRGAKITMSQRKTDHSPPHVRKEEEERGELPIEQKDTKEVSWGDSASREKSEGGESVCTSPVIGGAKYVTETTSYPRLAVADFQSGIEYHAEAGMIAAVDRGSNHGISPSSSFLSQNTLERQTSGFESGQSDRSPPPALRRKYQSQFRGERRGHYSPQQGRISRAKTAEKRKGRRPEEGNNLSVEGCKLV